MRIKSIELQNFRNIASLSLQAAPDVNVIHGENAQGKTNLTEAIWMFTGAKSFRGAKDREMIRFGEDHCRTDRVSERTAGGNCQHRAESTGCTRRKAGKDRLPQ